MYELGVTATFSAAHQLVGYRGKCEALHGHTYRVEVRVRVDELDEIGLGLDFNDLKKRIDKILEGYDHAFLNEVPPFNEINPSAENLARVIFETLAEDLPDGATLHQVRVWESENAWATYQP